MLVTHSSNNASMVLMVKHDAWTDTLFGFPPVRALDCSSPPVIGQYSYIQRFSIASHGVDQGWDTVVDSDRNPLD